MGLIGLTFVYLLLIHSLLLLLISEGFLSLLLPLKFEQTLRFGRMNANLFLHIAVGLHQAVEHEDKIIVEFNLILLEELRN